MLRARNPHLYLDIFLQLRLLLALRQHKGLSKCLEHNTPTFATVLKDLRRRHSIKSLRNLLLPSISRLAIDLSSRLHLLRRTEETCSDYDFVAHYLLVVVGVGCAVCLC